MLKDPCLDKFEEEYEAAGTVVERAILVFNLVGYLKLRYRGVSDLFKLVSPKLDYLKSNVAKSSGSDFLKIQKVIAYASRSVADASGKYGSGFRKVPCKRERDKLAQAYPRVDLLPCTDLEPANGSLDDFGNDIRTGHLGNGGP